MRGIARLGPLLAISLLVLSGGSPPPKAATAPGARSAKPAATLSDAEIEQAIRARFAKSKIGANHFEVKVANGVATLSGQAEVIQHKGVATRLARLGGAREVRNQIRVSEAARQKARANLDKARKKAQVKRTEKRSQPGG